jgi:multiple sugar transport system permease protein
LGIIERNIGFLTDISSQWGPISIPLLSVSVVRIWFGLPFAVIMVLAGLQSIPKDLYEAAELDGASMIERFRSVTIPLLMPVLTILLALLTIGGLGHFDINYVMTGGGPNNFTNTLAVIAYQEAFTSFRFDYASAIATVILVFTTMIAMVYIWRRYKELHDI